MKKFKKFIATFIVLCMILVSLNFTPTAFGTAEGGNGTQITSTQPKEGIDQTSQRKGKGQGKEQDQGQKGKIDESKTEDESKTGDKGGKDPNSQKGKGKDVDPDIPQITGGGNKGTVVVFVTGLKEIKGIKITLDREGTIQTATTDEYGKATLSNVNFSGDITLSSQEVFGYINPSPKEIKVTGNNSNVEETFEYIETEIVPVERVIIKYNDKEVAEDEVVEVIFEPIFLTAEVLPVDATNKKVTWKSDDDTIAEVSDDGRVYGVSQGTTTVTVTTEDGEYSDSCTVTVGVEADILALVDPDPITVPLNAIVPLPEKVKALLNSGWIKFVPVTWDSETVDTSAAGTIVLRGSVEGTDKEVVLEVTVKDEEATPLTGIVLDESNISLKIYGDDYESTQLTATLQPENADISSIEWSSDNEEVVKVDGLELLTAQVTAQGVGTAIITVRITDMEGTVYEAFCSVAVAIDGSPLETDTRIFAAFYEGTQTEEFEYKEDVYIVGNNLPISDYFIKVEAKGKDGELGKGTIPATDIDTNGYVKFKLYDVTEFDLMTKNSNEYFVYMSTEDDFPKDDEKTLKTNFKIEKAVPTGDIVVTTSLSGGDITDKSEIKFILGRVLYEGTAEETTEQYEDYLSETAENGYTDEVKAWGITDADGKIEGIQIWAGESELDPGKWYSKEILKIGGYMLLQEGIDGYQNNLDQLNPSADDGELFKEVHINRDVTETRDVINIYIGSETD